MTRIEKIRETIYSLAMIFTSIILLTMGTDGYLVIIAILGLSLVVRGLKRILFFFIMARNMVGGKAILYRGVLIFDMGLFAESLIDVPVIYIMLYVLGFHIFTGFVKILRSLEGRKYGSSNWIIILGHGIIDIVIAFDCILHLQSSRHVIIVYSIWLIYSAIVKMGGVFRKQEIVYIQ